MIDEKKLIEEIEILRVPVNGFRGGKILLSEFEVFYKELILRIIEEQPKVGEWIPVSEHLPEDLDNRFYMCILENHEDDLPMFLQFDDELGFGYLVDRIHPQTLGYLGDEFITIENLECEKVVAWMQLPDQYKGENYER